MDRLPKEAECVCRASLWKLICWQS